jgi:hypothetical protein
VKGVVVLACGGSGGRSAMCFWKSAIWWIALIPKVDPALSGTKLWS